MEINWIEYDLTLWHLLLLRLDAAMTPLQRKLKNKNTNAILAGKQQLNVMIWVTGSRLIT